MNVLSALEATNLRFHGKAELKDYTTFRLGGQCPLIIHCATPEELEQAVTILHQHSLNWLLVGEGSNIVASDQGVPVPIIRYISAFPLTRFFQETVDVSGSTRLDDLVAMTAERGLAGINYASGIPGTVGGAVVGNAGAFGRQIGDVVDSVLIMRKDGSAYYCPASDLRFSYRHSRLKDSDETVISVNLNLKKADAETLQRERADILAQRRNKHPDYKTLPCAGSFFRNIEPSSNVGQRQAAGWFLEQAGAKTFRSNGATVFPKHANIIVHEGPCCAEDVYTLAQRMATVVKEKFQLDLIREVRYLGHIAGQGENGFW